MDLGEREERREKKQVPLAAAPERGATLKSPERGRQSRNTKAREEKERKPRYTSRCAKRVKSQERWEQSFPRQSCNSPPALLNSSTREPTPQARPHAPTVQGICQYRRHASSASSFARAPRPTCSLLRASRSADRHPKKSPSRKEPTNRLRELFALVRGKAYRLQLVCGPPHQ